MKSRIDTNLILFIGLIAIWIALAGNVQTPASMMHRLENSADPSAWFAALESSDRTVRKYAEDNVLEKCPSDLLCQYAMRMVESGDISDQRVALWILARVNMPGKGAVAAGFLGDENASLREAALEVLASDPVPQARETLINLTKEQDFEIRGPALKALAALANPDDLPIFIQYIGDPIPSVRNAAIDGITAVAPQSDDLIPSLMSVAWGSDVAASREALRLIGEFGGPEALEGLFYFLDSSLTGISSEAAIAIGRIDGQEAVDRALEIFRTGRNRSRAQAARALGELRAREAANDLLTAVLNGSEDIWVRYYALEALGWCGNEGMVPQIVSIMENPDSDPRLVRIGIEALGALGGETVLEIYDRIIAGDEHFNLDRTGGQTALVSCIAGLGKMNSDESRERLRSILKSAEEDNLDVIIGVIRALGNVGTPDDIGTIRALESEIPFLGEPSDEAIGSIGTRFPSSGQVDN